MFIEQLYTNCLAEAAYWIESNGEAAVIDPLRETAPYLEKAKKRGVKIKYVFETHFHADFVSGHVDLAAITGAAIVYGPGAETKYKIHSATDGEEFKIGNVTIKVIHTPGHTPESSCYLLLDEESKPYALFSGDTVFVGDVGRPDLLDGKMSKEELASMMFDSIAKLKNLPDEVILYPGHGPGSACGKNIGKETWSTIGAQKKSNYALVEENREKFISLVTSGLSAPPQYFFRDAQINKNGYENIEEVISKNMNPLTAEEVENLCADGTVLVLDTRHQDDFEKGFIPGSVFIGLAGTYAVWVGTLISMETPLVLVTEPGQEKEAVLRLARVGYENVKGFLDGGISSWTGAGKPLERIASIEAGELRDAAAVPGSFVLDVRRKGEFETSHVTGAAHICLSSLEKSYGQLDPEKKYLIHCASGYRSVIAASLMKAKGFHHVVNVHGGFNKISETGIPLSSLQLA